MLLRNFLPKTILNTMINLDRPIGNTLPEHHVLSFIVPSFTISGYIALANYTDYTGIFYDVHNVTAELYDPLYFTGFINGSSNDTTIESTFLPFTDKTTYEISYFFHTRDSIYLFFNFTPFDIITNIEFVIVVMQYSVYEKVFKALMDFHGNLLRKLVSLRRA